MCKNHGIFVGMTMETIAEKLKGVLFMTVCADGEPAPDSDGNGNGEPGGGGSSINFEDLVTKARAEEKARQFKRIEKLNEEVKVLKEQHNTDLLKIAEFEKKLKEAEDKLTKAGSGDSEELKSLKKEYEDLKREKDGVDKELSEFKKNPPKSEDELRKELREELEEEYRVKNHRVEILAANKDDLLIPELVTGTTVEELDASLKAALERSKEIMERATGGNVQQGGQQTQTRRKAKAPATSGGDFNQYSIDYLASLDPRSPEYKEFRRKAGLT